MNQSELTMSTGHEVLMESSPYGMEKKKLGMWVFIVSDACTFATFLFGYGYMRVGSQNWGTPFEFSSILNGIIMTFVLLSSSLTHAGGGSGHAEQDRKLRPTNGWA